MVTRKLPVLSESWLSLTPRSSWPSDVGDRIGDGEGCAVADPRDHVPELTPGSGASGDTRDSAPDGPATSSAAAVSWTCPVLEKANTSPRLTEIPVGIHPAPPGTSMPVVALAAGTLPLVPEVSALMMSWADGRLLLA